MEDERGWRERGQESEERAVGEGKGYAGRRTWGSKIANWGAKNGKLRNFVDKFDR